MFETILVVDDDADALELISDALAARDFQVIPASSGPQAVRLLREVAPDAAVIDIHMPDMNGFALVEVIRATPGLERLPIILLTADPSRDHGQRAVSASLSYMLAKPLDADQLVRALRQSIPQPFEETPL